MTSILTETPVTDPTQQATSKGGKSPFLAIAEQAAGHLKAITPPPRKMTRIHGTD